MLLSGGGSSRPNWQQAGTLSGENWPTITIENLRADAVTVHEPEFWLYHNGQLLQEKTAADDPLMESSGASYRVLEDWSIPFEEGDTVEFTMACADDYGLHYEFLAAAWTLRNDRVENIYPEEWIYSVLSWE